MWSLSLSKTKILLGEKHMLHLIGFRRATKDFLKIAATLMDLPGDEETRLKNEDRLFFVGGMVADLIGETRGLQKPEVLEALDKLARSAKAPFVRQHAVDMFLDLAQAAPAYAQEKALSATESVITSDPDEDLRLHAVMKLATMVGQLKDDTRAIEILAHAMADKHPATREQATRSWSHYIMYEPGRWNSSVRDTFMKAATTNGLAAEEMAQIIDEVEQIYTPDRQIKAVLQ